MTKNADMEAAIGIQIRALVYAEGHRPRLPPDIKNKTDIRERAETMFAWIAANPGCTKSDMINANSQNKMQVNDMLASLQSRLVRTGGRVVRYEVK